MSPGRAILGAAIVLAAGVSFPSEPGAATYVIRPDGTGDFPTIQAGIDGAAPGDILELTDGTFTGPGNRDLNVHRRLVIRAQAGPGGLCIIDCQASASARHRGMAVQDNAAGTLLQGITIQNGWVMGSGGGIECGETTLTLDRCILWRNHAEYDGGAIYAPVGCTLTLTGCMLPGNSTNQGGSGGVLYLEDGSTAEISYCTFNDNWGDSGGAVYCAYSETHLDHCTINASDGPQANAALSAGPGGEIVAANTIVAFGTDEAAHCAGSGMVTMTCCDVYGNAGGNWTNCIAGQYGSHGNISADPLFCWPYGAPFALDVSSPCAPQNNQECRQIGAWGVGCPASDAEEPLFTSEALHLAAPAPNPATGAVRIGYAVAPAESHAGVSLEIFDAAGRLIRALPAAYALSGAREVDWDGADGHGRRVPAGTYYCRLTAGGHSLTRPIAILR